MIKKKFESPLKKDMKKNGWVFEGDIMKKEFKTDWKKKYEELCFDLQKLHDINVETINQWRWSLKINLVSTLLMLVVGFLFGIIIGSSI